jgi:hypothetical protein
MSLKIIAELLSIFAGGKINEMQVQAMLDESSLKADGTPDGSPKISVVDIKELSLFAFLSSYKKPFLSLTNLHLTNN